MMITGKVLASYGDNIATEMMVSSKHVRSLEPAEIAKVAMKDIDPNFYEKMSPGGILLAGSNFGCSSSREWAPIALKAANVKLIVAKSFARIFYRNAINIGLPIIECIDTGRIDEGDSLEVDLTTGTIRNLTKNETLQGTRLPDFLLNWLQQGGLIPVLKAELGVKG